MEIEWSAHAVSDLKAISEYIEQDRNLETANRVTRTIYEAIQSLRTLPYRGRYGRIDNTRELVIPRLPYIVVYRVLKERLLVLNVVHGLRGGRKLTVGCGLSSIENRKFKMVALIACHSPYRAATIYRRQSSSL